MKGFLSIGWIMTILAIGVFYVRILYLRGKKIREEKDEALRKMKEARNRKASKKKKSQEKKEDGGKKNWDIDMPRYQVWSWPMAAAALLFVLLGIGMKDGAWILASYQEWWWTGTTIGIILLAFCIH